MSRIVTISFTPLDAGGGVPKFNRDIHAAFPDRECVHYSWWDFQWWPEMEGLPEWEKARVLNHYLIQQRKVKAGDVIIADGFWADGLDTMPKAISHSHGIWGHVTKYDVDHRIKPENPLHHIKQVEFRRRWIGQGRHITAVSDFIAEEMWLQWGFKVDRVINNGVDTDVYKSAERMSPLNDLLIIHGVNDPGNTNKGWDHIVAVKKYVPSAHVLSLDEAHALFNDREPGWTKPEVLAQADIVVHPSGFEGNSMFVAETLACGVPIVGYDVGFLWLVKRDLPVVGKILDRNNRSPLETGAAVVAMVMGNYLKEWGENARKIALERLSIQGFQEDWRSYVDDVERKHA